MQRPRKAAAAAGKWEMRSEQASGSKWHLLLMRFFNELPAKQIPTKPGRPRPRTIPITTPHPSEPHTCFSSLRKNYVDNEYTY